MTDSKPRAAYIPSPPHGPFLVLEENRFAHAAVERLGEANTPARTLFVSGPAGVGKSHLAGCLARALGRERPAPRVAHVTADGFADEFASATAADSIPEFHESYAGIDVLICEDLHALRRRPEAQRRLVAIFDEVLGRGGRVLITSRLMPGESRPIEPRLVNRCRGGVSAAIRMPGRESREGLLRHFASTRQIGLPGDAARLLAEAVPASPREMLATIARLEMESRLARKPLDRAFVSSWLARETGTPQARLDQIARAVAGQFGIALRGIRAGDRRRGSIVPRQCAMYLARELTKEPLARIASYFGRRNHSTVTHACERVAALLADDAGLRQQLDRIRRTLGAPAS